MGMASPELNQQSLDFFIGSAPVSYEADWGLFGATRSPEFKCGRFLEGIQTLIRKDEELLVGGGVHKETESGGKESLL